MSINPSTLGTGAGNIVSAITLGTCSRVPTNIASLLSCVYLVDGKQKVELRHSAFCDSSGACSRGMKTRHGQQSLLLPLVDSGQGRKSTTVCNGTDKNARKRDTGNKVYHCHRLIPVRVGSRPPSLMALTRSGVPPPSGSGETVEPEIALTASCTQADSPSFSCPVHF